MIYYINYVFLFSYLFIYFILIRNLSRQKIKIVHTELRLSNPDNGTNTLAPMNESRINLCGVSEGGRAWIDRRWRLTPAAARQIARLRVYSVIRGEQRRGKKGDQYPVSGACDLGREQSQGRVKVYYRGAALDRSFARLAAPLLTPVAAVPLVEIAESRFAFLANLSIERCVGPLPPSRFAFLRGIRFADKPDRTFLVAARGGIVMLGRTPRRAIAD